MKAESSSSKAASNVAWHVAIKVAAGALAAALWIANVSLSPAAEPNTPALSPQPAPPRQPTTSPQISLQPLPSPQAVYDNALRDATPKGKGTGEGFCWHGAYHMGGFVRAYEATLDPAWLDWGVKYYDWCVGLMAAGPDGYKGWIGPAGNGMWYDDHVGDAILVERMLEFSELVLKDANLKKKYEAAANRYVEIAKKDLIEKWDKRDTWREDGEYGCYVAHNKACEPEKLTEWKDVTVGVDEPPGRTLPLNKQNEMALAALRLYRITGEKPYLEKATKIFSFMRSRFQYVADKDYYCWNYWEPFGPWDVDLDKKTTRHWVGVHGYRPYQATEIGQIAQAYHTGIVFTSLDMHRIINTNLKVMWNGDKAAPKFVNSNALLAQPGQTPEQKKAQEDAENKLYAREGSRPGVLWSALSDFSQTVRDLEVLGMSAPTNDTQEQIGRVYFQNVTLKTPPSFRRKYSDVADVPQVPATNCSSLNQAAVLPHRLSLSGGKPSVVLCKSRVVNDLELAVYSADGKDKKCVLYKGKIGSGVSGLDGFFVTTWDGADPATKAKLPKGNYVVRWTVPDGSRDYGVVIAE